MKISRIKISNFRHFEDIDIDLTYPKGHLKEGLPLEKVCIIGQNGTGKTTILNLIDDFFISMNSKELTHGKLRDVYLNFDALPEGAVIQIEYFTPNNEKVLLLREGKKGRGDIFSYKIDNIRKIPSKTHKTYHFKPSMLLYIPFGMNSRFFLESSEDNDEKEILEYWEKVVTTYFYGFPYVLKAFEKTTFGESEKYKKLNADYKLHLVNRVVSGENVNIVEDLQKWENENKNPLIIIASYLDKLLTRFHLRTKITLDSTDEISSIQLESTTTNETIAIEDLSSGTRQILNVARPLYHLLKENSIVLIDEPETSLYPDLQREIVSYYSNLREDLGDTVQYFFATHSPIILSSFDPWEVVDLEFDDSGNIERHLYYEGENHVDNYDIHPKYLRWDSILDRAFDVPVSGNPTREEAIFELAQLNVKMEKWKKEGTLSQPNDEIKAFISRYKRLLLLMDWKETNEDN